MKALFKFGAALAAVTFLNVSCSSVNETALKNSQPTPAAEQEECATPSGST